MTIRKPIQIVEFDVDYCPLTYGTAPCGAALGVSGDRKCFNTFKTCQSKGNFGKPVEPVADRTYASGDALINGDFAKADDLWFAADVVIPSGPTGCIAEVGGVVSGMYLGFTSGQLVFRVGDGGSGTPANCAKISVDAVDFEGKTGTFYAQVDISENYAALWFFDVLARTLTQVGTATAAGSFAIWAGAGDGKFGGANTAPTGEDATDFSGTALALRVADSTEYTVTTDGSTLTLRFAQNINGLPRNPLVYPFMAAPVTTNPTRVNLGAYDEKIGTLGRRARVTIKLRDSEDSDIYWDKYHAERISGAAQSSGVGYNPKDQGTFFGRMRARFPYYTGRAVRVLEGYEGQALGDMRTRHYVASEWSGPDESGNVTITAKGVLDLADNDKALCPRPTKGQLSEDIDDSYLGDVTLVPENIGAEYAASGTMCIGSENMTYTRSGDVFTIIARGVDGTATSSHNQGDTAQDCFVVRNGTINGTAATLMTEYATIPASYVPTSDWSDEVTRWLPGLRINATISKPTGVTKLLGELAELGVIFWDDDIAQEIKLRANRPLDLDETATEYTDAKTFIQGTLSTKDEHEKRLSQVLFWHGQINATGSQTGENMRRVAVDIDGEAEGPREYNQTRLHEIYSRWLGAGDDSIASVVAARLVNRYRDIPRSITFEVDAKDAATAQLGGIITVTTRIMQDDTGAIIPQQMQINSIEEVQSGHRIKVTAETYAFYGAYGFIAPNSYPDYTSATDEQKDHGTFFADDGADFADGRSPYRFF